MKRRSLLKTMAVLPVVPQVSGAPATRAWLGADYWANPLQDWRKSGDRFECHAPGGDRNVFWLTKEIDPSAASFTMSVRLGRLDGTGDGWAGFRFGMRGHFSDYRDTAIRGLGVDAGVASDGRLFIGKAGVGASVASLHDLTLKLEAKGNRLRLSAGDKAVEETIPIEWIGGGVALVCPFRRGYLAPCFRPPNRSRQTAASRINSAAARCAPGSRIGR